MESYNEILVRRERKLLREIEGMKFSFTKIRKLVELNNVLSLCRK